VSYETLSKNDLPVNSATETQRDYNKIDHVLANHGHAVLLPPCVWHKPIELTEPQLKRFTYEKITAGMHLQKLLQVTNDVV
jgi:hypothetical protein